MDERSTSLRADPYDASDVYPHSGNGVTQECLELTSQSGSFKLLDETKESSNKKVS